MTILKHYKSRTTRFASFWTATIIAIAFSIAIAINASPSMAQTNSLPMSKFTISVNQIKQRIEKNYGVRVLRIEEVIDRGKAVLAVTTMGESGDFNDALQVNTVVANPETGDLIPQYRSTPNGMRFAAPDVGFRTSPRLASAP